MPRRVLKFDIAHENFDLFFARKTYNLSDKQKDLLPDEINFKLFNGGGQFHAKNSYKLSFLAKLFVLIKALKYRFTVFLEDEKEGISVEDYLRQRGSNGHSQPVSNDLEMTGDFVLAGRELFDAFNRLNAIHTSPQYNYLVKEKNFPTPDIVLWKNQMNYIISFFANYEANKKKVILNMGLSLAELLTLFYLYDGQEKLSSSVYSEKYKYAYNAGKREIQEGFKTLQDKGLVQKIGKFKGCRLKITTLGKDMITNIVRKYFIDF